MTGRRSGRRRSAPLEYLDDGDRLTLVSRRSRVWWRNFAPPRTVEVWLRGARRAGTASVADASLEERAAVLRRLHAAAGRDLNEDAALARAREAVVVTVDLSPPVEPPRRVAVRLDGVGTAHGS